MATCEISPERSFCWACSIPELVWVKLALLECTVAYNITEDTVIILQPVLLAAENQRQAIFNRVYHGQRWPPVPAQPAPLKHTWRLKPRTMTPEDWHDLATEIAEALASYHFGGYAP